MTERERRLWAALLFGPCHLRWGYLLAFARLSFVLPAPTRSGASHL